MVEITPNLLQFSSPLAKPSTELIHITNTSEEAIAFKVKTTAPKLYCVRPNAAIVQPGQTAEVSVILLGLKEEPTEEVKCNDKFLIVSLPAPYELGEQTVAEVWPKLEGEFKSQSVSKKIKVKFNVETGELIEPAAAADELEAEHEASGSASALPPSALAVEEDTTEEPSQEDRSKIDSLNEKLDSSVAKSEKLSTSGNSASVREEKASSTPLTTILLFALIAIIIAWLFF